MSEEEVKEEAAVEEAAVEEEAQEEEIVDIDKMQFFRQETISNAQNIVIDVMVPVSIPKSGKMTVDKTKPKVFIGKTPVNMGNQVIPFPFAIEGANNIYEALHQFDKSAARAVEEANQRVAEEYETMKKKKESEIVVPGNVGGGKIIT